MNHINNALSVALFGLLVLAAASAGSERDPYRGVLRVYVVEPDSRYVDNLLQPYPFGFLDFAFVGNFELDDGASLRQVVVWDGSAEFSDITSDNIMALAVVSDADPVWSDAYPPNENMFKAYYADGAAAATPGSPGANVTAQGFTHTVFAEVASSGG